VIVASLRQWTLVAASLVACSAAPRLGLGNHDGGLGETSGDSGDDTGSGTSCTPASQCTSDGSVQTCGSDGKWTSAWPCVTEVCASGACSGSTGAGASCEVSAEGTTDCGANQETCCESLELPGGTYFRTYTNDGTGAIGLDNPAWVSGVRLDKYLVTVGRFRQFVAATLAGWVPPAGSGKHVHLNDGQGLVNSGGAGYEPGWDPGDSIEIATTVDQWALKLNCDPQFGTWTDTAGAQETLPMNCIDWYEAYAFCIWDGGFLPSEAEWEYAAAGGDEQREYPWGSTNPGTGFLYLISDCNYPPGSSSCTAVLHVAPVGTAALGAGRWGQLDLAGNLTEWILDWDAPYVQPCTDCVFLTDVSYRSVRGGSWDADTQNVFPWADDGDVPTSRNASYGVRCARSP
jgi:sulfatase modifying factor 1